MNPTIPWLGDLHIPNYLSSWFCSFVVHFYVHHYKELQCMLKQASTNTNQLWTNIRVKLGLLTINPRAFENPICHILSKRISFDAKIEHVAL